MKDFNTSTAGTLLTMFESTAVTVLSTAMCSRCNAPTAAMVYQLRELVAGRITRVAHFEQPVFAWR